MKPHSVAGILIAIALFISKGYAQPYDVQWAHATGSVQGLEIMADIDVDLQTGEIIGTGYFNGTVDFDPGVGEAVRTPHGINDVFIAKYDPNGNLIWVIQLEGEEEEVGRKIKFDPSGNGDFYITGFYYGYMDINPDPNEVEPLVYTNTKDVFLAKFSSSGALIWARSFGSGEAEHVNDLELVLDERGGVVLGGTFSSFCDFDNSGGFEVGSHGYEDAYVIRYDRDGNVMWVSAVGGEKTEQVFDIAVDPQTNDVYITGYYHEIADFDPGPDTLLLEAPDYREFYLLKLNASGALSWVKTMDAWITIPYFNMADTNHVMLVGGYLNSYDLDPDPNQTFPEPSQYQHIYLMQLDKEGNRQWLKTFEGDGGAIPMDIAQDPAGSGKVLVSVSFDSSFIVPGTGDLFLSHGGNDILVMEFDSLGEYQDALHFGSDGPEQAWGVAIDLENHVYLSGIFFSASLTFGNIEIYNQDPSYPASDLFLTKLVPTIVSTHDNAFALPGQVFPNPASSHIYVEWKSNGLNWYINLINPLGQIVYTTKGDGNQHELLSHQIEMQYWIPGTYAVQISQGDQQMTRSILIQ